MSGFKLSDYDYLATKLRCPNEDCPGRGSTFIKRGRRFICNYCGMDKRADFWHKKFNDAPEEMTFKQASRLIGADPMGSTLRRARLEGRLKTRGRALRYNGKPSKREHIVMLQDLVEYYLTMYHHKRPKGSKNGKPKKSNTSK